PSASVFGDPVLVARALERLSSLGRPDPSAARQEASRPHGTRGGPRPALGRGDPWLLLSLTGATASVSPASDARLGSALRKKPRRSDDSGGRPNTRPLDADHRCP